MIPAGILGRLRPRGVFWRHLLAWAVHTVPYFLEPMTLQLSTLVFFILWTPGRRAVMRNLAAIDPKAGTPRLLVRAYRVFLNFAYTFTDSMHFAERTTGFDWELVGNEQLGNLADSSEGAIIITAHMGNYDLGSHMFAQRIDRVITTVRAPETDPESDRFAQEQRQRLSEKRFRVHYNTDPTTLAFELVDALRAGEIVAIQADRTLAGVPSLEATLFAQPVRLPAGPFALGLATQTLLYPLFVARVSHRRYRVIAREPIRCRRRGKDREANLKEAMEQWRTILEETIREYWYQWFAFEPFMMETRNESKQS